MVDVGVYAGLPKSVKTKFFKPFAEVQRLGVHGDGSCFFHSVAACVDLDAYHTRSHADRQQIGLRLRKKIQSHLLDGGEDKWKAFWRRRKLSKMALARVPSFQEIVAQANDPSAWAATHLIMYAMQKLRLNHIFIDATTNQIYCGVVALEKKRRPLVMILWVDHAHFGAHRDTQRDLVPPRPPRREARPRRFPKVPVPSDHGGPCVARRGPAGLQVRVRQKRQAGRPSSHRGHPEGSSRVALRHQRCQNDPDMVLRMWPDARIRKAFSHQFGGLSVCDMGSTPKVITFNEENWRRKPKPFCGTLEEYRQYLVMHEVGHAHGKLHERGVAGRKCPVMYQQTKGAGGEGQCFGQPFSSSSDEEGSTKKNM